MSSLKPAVILITGAFSAPVLFDDLKARLEALSYDVYVPVLATLGNNPGRTWKDDVVAINEVAIPLMDEGRKLLLVAWSYGSTPGTATVVTESVHQRAKRGHKGGWAAAMYMGGNTALEKGMSYLDMFGGSYDVMEWVDAGEPLLGGKVAYPNTGAREVVWGDLDDAEAAKWMKLAQGFSQDTMETPLEYHLSELDVPATFLIPDGDKAALPELQEAMAARVPEHLRSIERCPGGHIPFLTHPERVVSIISGLMDGLQKKQ